MGSGYRNSLIKIMEYANGRELVFWGTDSLSLYVYQDLLDMGYDIKYFVSEQVVDSVLCGKDVKNCIELYYEEKNKIFIVAFVFQHHGIIYERLIDLGFEFEKDFLLYGFGGYLRKFDVIDSLLGYNRYYGSTLGFQILGDEKEYQKPYKILVLGGSTTDPTMGNNIPWTKILYDKLKKVCPELVLINGGMAGYSATQEFYKYVRDGLEWKPDMVITYDGLNDVACMATDKDYPVLTPYAKKVFDYIEKKGNFAPDTLEIRNASVIVHGLSQKLKEDADRWAESIRKIHAVAEEFGSIHIGFFQPMIMTGTSVLSGRQKKLLKEMNKVLKVYGKWMEEMESFYRKVIPFIQKKEYMHDLTSIFDGKENMYYDFFHATDEGNEIVASEIYDKIILHILEKRRV